MILAIVQVECLEPLRVCRRLITSPPAPPSSDDTRPITVPAKAPAIGRHQPPLGCAEVQRASPATASTNSNRPMAASSTAIRRVRLCASIRTSRPAPNQAATMAKTIRAAISGTCTARLGKLAKPKRAIAEAETDRVGWRDIGRQQSDKAFAALHQRAHHQQLEAKESSRPSASQAVLSDQRRQPRHAACLASGW